MCPFLKFLLLTLKKLKFCNEKWISDKDIQVYNFRALFVIDVFKLRDTASLENVIYLQHQKLNLSLEKSL